MGTATASSSKGLWGGFAKQLWVGGWRGVGAIIQHERGSFQHLLSFSPSCIIVKGYFLLVQWLWLYFNLYVCELCLWVAGIKGFYFRGEHRKRGTYSVVWAGDHGVCHPGAEPWPWCTHCDGITDASQLPAAWRSKKRKIHIYVEKVCIYST